MSNVAIKSMITGIDEASRDAGRHPGWPSVKVAEAVIEKVASEWTGPEVLDAPLPKQAALEIESRLVKAAEEIAKKHKPMGHEKAASAETVHTRAAQTARYWMDKAAFDAQIAKEASGPGSLTNVGPNTEADAAKTDDLAKLDLSQRPQGYAQQPQGADTTLPGPGVTGPKETPDPAGPSVSPSVSNSLTDHSAKAASYRVYGELKAAGLPEKVAEAVADAMRTSMRVPLTDELVKEAMASLSDGTQAAMEKAASVSAPARDGVVRFLYDRLLKVAEGGSKAKAVMDFAKKHKGKAMAGAAVAGAAVGGKALYNHLKQRGASDADAKQEVKEAAYAASLASAALGYKTATDMEADDLEGGDGSEDANGGEPSQPPQPPQDGGEDEQTQLLRQIWEAIKQLAPGSDDAQTAAAGLIDHGPEGMNVLAHVAKTAKTAAAADEMLRRVLQDNPQLRKTATVDTYNFVRGEFAKVAAARGGHASNLLSLLKQSGAGSLTNVGPNTESDAAKKDDLAKLDLTQRPEGYAQSAQGKAPVNAPPQEQKIENAPRDGVPQVKGDNIVTREDKKASLSAEDQAYMAGFAKVAASYGPSLPAGWNDDQKTAALASLLATPPSGRDARLKELLKS